MQERKGRATTSNINISVNKRHNYCLLVKKRRSHSPAPLRHLKVNPLTRRALFEAALSWRIRPRDRSARSLLLRGHKEEETNKDKNQM